MGEEDMRSQRGYGEVSSVALEHATKLLDQQGSAAAMGFIPECMVFESYVELIFAFLTDVLS